jgi:hypothetical protein
MGFLQFKMRVPHKISEWLELAFTEQVDRINEMYFWDGRDNEFYFCFITDYLLVNASMKISSRLPQQIQRFKINPHIYNPPSTANTCPVT